jgi:hypothetical protein
MTTLLTRHFTVERPLDQAWQHLARAERWPTWAKHSFVPVLSRRSASAGYKPLLGADLAKAAAWVNAPPDWAPLEVLGDFMRERALETITTFPWALAQTRVVLDPSR